MAEHSLPDGRRWIENLMRLGEALQYRVKDEHNVAPDDEEPAPVDVAWLRSDSDRFPLFIFEIESRPSGQMTYNAAKVFSQDTDLFEKPLFHFHIVVQGGSRSGRLKAAKRSFGHFNYRVYRAAKRKHATAALCDILSQHRRVEARLDAEQLAGVLGASDWREPDLDAVWRHAERCEFEADFERVYASGYLADPAAFRTRLARRLTDGLDGEPVRAGQYPGLLAQRAAPLLQAPLMALLAPDRAADALAWVQSWQGPAASATIGPPFQRGAEHDNVTLALAPAAWAAMAAAARTAEARSWALEQLELLLGPPSARLPLPLSGCAAAWMLHIARAGGPEHEAAFERAADHVRELSGLPATHLASPPGRGPMMDALDEWQGMLDSAARTAPNWEELKRPPYTDQDAASMRGRLEQALAAALADDAPLDGGVVLAALWAESNDGR